MRVKENDQVCTDLIQQALDVSKSEISTLKDLTKKQEVKIGSQKAKIAKIKAKNTELKIQLAGKDEELVQKRFESEAFKAEITALGAAR